MKFGIESGIELYCQACHKKVMTIVQNGEVIYPHRRDLYDKVFLQCPHCKNYVSADPLSPQDTVKSWTKRHKNKTIPTAECRATRRAIHGIIDPIWRSGTLNRAYIYQRLSTATGVHPYHNGSLLDRAVAEKAYDEAKKLEREAIVLGFVPKHEWFGRGRI